MFRLFEKEILQQKRWAEIKVSAVYVRSDIRRCSYVVHSGARLHEDQNGDGEG